MTDKRLNIDKLANTIYRRRKYLLTIERIIAVATTAIFLLFWSYSPEKIHVSNYDHNSIHFFVEIKNGYIYREQLWSNWVMTFTLFVTTWCGYELYLLRPSILNNKTGYIGNIPNKIYRLFELSLLSWTGLFTSILFNFGFIQLMGVGLGVIKEYNKDTNEITMSWLIQLLIINVIVHLIWWQIIVSPAYQSRQR
jgi:hypothetical protein